MGLRPHKDDLTTPAGAVAFLLEHDPTPVLQVFAGEREALTREVAGSWDGLTKEQRLALLRNATRFYVTLAGPEVLEEPHAPEFLSLIALTGAKSRVMGFLWERTYGEKMVDVGADWGPFDPDELEGMLRRPRGAAG
jgi:hypothetical protein